MNIEPKALLSDGEGIPTTTDNYFNYDYGEEINQKLRSLNWTPKQYDAFLDYAPKETLISDADALGIFSEEV